MKTQEFSSSFDTLVSSYAHTAEFGDQASLYDVVFDEYEKSVFLTTAQEEIVRELYSGKYTGESFEFSEKIRRELDTLVTQEVLIQSGSNEDFLGSTDEEPTPGESGGNEEPENPAEAITVLTDHKYFHSTYELPSDILYIIYEQVSYETTDPCLKWLVADVYPITHDEYWRVRNNPFRGPNNRRVLRLDQGKSVVELISVNSIKEYLIRYLRYPNPIILVNLKDSDLKVNDKQDVSECELPDILHRDILERAVRLALTSKMISSKNKGEK